MALTVQERKARVEQLTREALQNITDAERWQSFLTVSGYLSEFTAQEQIMIFAQNPRATVCKRFDDWQDVGRRVNRGEKAISIPRFSHKTGSDYIVSVFDAGQTNGRMLPQRWESTLDEVQVADLENNAATFAALNFDRDAAGFFAILDKAGRVGYDKDVIGAAFMEAVYASVRYSIQARVGGEPVEFSESERKAIGRFKSQEAIEFLASSVNRAVGQALRETQRQMIQQQEQERSKQHERGEIGNLGEGRTDRENGPESELGVRGGTGRDVVPEIGTESRQPEQTSVRTAESGLSEGRASSGVRPPALHGTDGNDFSGLQRGVLGDAEVADKGNGSEGRRDRADETNRPAEMGGDDEQHPSESGGNRERNDGLRLNQNQRSAAQLSFYEEEAESEQLPASFSMDEGAPSSYRYPQDVVDLILQQGFNDPDSRKRIVYEFAADKSKAELAAFLQKEYGGNGVGITTRQGDMSAFYTEEGILLNGGHSALSAGLSRQLIPWIDAVERIDEMLEEGLFATNVELIEAEGFARKEAAETLWHFYHDVNREHEHFQPISALEEVRSVGFSKETEELAKRLEDADFRSQLLSQLKIFNELYQQDNSFIRFRLYPPIRGIEAVENLMPPRKQYTWKLMELPQAAKFITNDEIDAELARYGSGFEGGKRRIVEFFEQNKGLKERADFLKNEFGIGGYGIPRGFDQWHDHKGISLEKKECAEKVHMSWTEVAKRFDRLITLGRFTLPQQEQQQQEQEQEPNLTPLSQEESEKVPSGEVFEEQNDVQAVSEQTESIQPEELTERERKTLPSADELEIGADFDEKKALVENPEVVRLEARLIELQQLQEHMKDVNKHYRRYHSLENYPNMTAEEAAKLRQTMERRSWQKDAPFDSYALTNNNAEIKRLTQRIAELKTDYAGWDFDGGHVDANKVVNRLQVFFDAPPEPDLRKKMKQNGFKWSPSTGAWQRQLTDNAIRSAGRIAEIAPVGGESVMDVQRRGNAVSAPEPTMEAEPTIETVPEPEQTVAAEPEQTEGQEKYRVGQQVMYQDRPYTISRIDRRHEPKTIALKDDTGMLNGFISGEQILMFRQEQELDRILTVMESEPEVETEQTAEPERTAEQEVAPKQTIEAEPSGEAEQEISLTAQNFRITDDRLGEGGAKAKFQANMAAITTLKNIERQSRTATPEEQEILSRYVGFGALSDAFDERKENWQEEYRQLKSLLTPEEYAAARASTLNAHYTSPTVIKAIYETVERMGFPQGGKILEPSMGVGNFFGLLPEQMQDSQLSGVELDSITGRIAKQLYPNADIQVKGFEKTNFPDNTFDLAIGNVPFGGFQLNEQRYNAMRMQIHDHFFVKSMDKVRPGGIIAFVTSSGTMDKANDTVRRHLAKQGELLGAVRLPNNAFKANAGTEVTSDIIFLRKRETPLETVPDADWLSLGQTADGIMANRYFVNHPEMVLGTLTMGSNMYGGERISCEPRENQDLASDLKAALSNIQGEFGQYVPPEQTTEQADKDAAEQPKNEADFLAVPEGSDVRNYSYTVIEDKLYYRRNSLFELCDKNAMATERAKGMVELRDIMRSLMQAQTEGASDETVAALQLQLNAAYDGFTERYGRIGDKANDKAFEDDSGYYLLTSLENTDEDGKFASKADIFTKRTIRPKVVIDHCDTSVEALAVSLSEKGGVNMGYMSSLTGKTEDELASDLRGIIYLEYRTNTWQTADDFLSGNVRQKLKYYEEALEWLPEDAKNRSEVASNVEALKKVQPKDLEASEINVELGATWIPPETIREFLGEVLHRWNSKVSYADITSEWRIDNKSTGMYDTLATETFGTSRKNAYELLQDALNLTNTKVFDPDPDDVKKRILNKSETIMAQEKQELLKSTFKDWIWKEPERRRELCAIYNERFNSHRLREYDGSHITFDGMNTEIQLREHQKNAIARALYGGNTLLAHEVGAGKSFEMAAIAMESKRLGLSHKSLFVVPNHLTEQMAGELLRLYPQANVLVTSKKDFQPKNRKKFCAKIASGDYDAIIMGHSQFEKVPLSAERQEAMIQAQIDDIIVGIDLVKHENGDRFTVKQMERTRKALEARLEKVKESKKDDVVTFEELGVDRLFVDEAQNYKNLFMHTKLRNVAGLSTSEAQKSSDMFFKCRYMDELTGGKGVVFATGTPVSNSLTELYTMQRYLQYDRLEEQGFAHFDAWASTFGKITNSIELAPEGTGFRQRSRISFNNVPELMTIFKDVADIKTSDQLDLPVPEAEFHLVTVKPTEHQVELMKGLSERADKVHNKQVDPSEDNMLKITTDGRKIGLDQRLVNPLLPDEPQSKINVATENVFNTWSESKDRLGTQLVFCDFSTPTKGEKSFNVYDDMRKKLIAKGIPPEEIAFIHDADSEAKKTELFKKMNAGKVRILFGSTFKCGAGTNVQKKMVAMHDIDCPWRPGDLSQRAGRIIRQGNENKHVHIYRYATEGTFDAYLWQTVEKKQREIAQIMTSRSAMRSCDDVDEITLSYAEMKAQCSGNPEIREKMELDVEVSKLTMMEGRFLSNKFKLEDRLLTSFPREITEKKSLIHGLTVDKAKLEAVQDFSMELSGKVYTDKMEAGAALLKRCQQYTGTKDITIGRFNGFDMSIGFDGLEQKMYVNLRGAASHRATLGSDERGNITRIENALEKIPEQLKIVTKQLSSLEQQQEQCRLEVESPFPHAQELKDKKARLAELTIKLSMADEKNPSQEQTEPERSDAEVAEPPTKSERSGEER